MSFGRPPSIGENFKINPPQRGSFPLDHEGTHHFFVLDGVTSSHTGLALPIFRTGDCKTFMLEYLGCLKANGNDNGKCRLLSKRYLECRMDK
jgi:cytochrome c oxidase assembly protein subunit 19